MQCVNPECRQDAKDLHTGTLRLLELAIPPEERIVRADSGFPIVVVPSRYFWLCSQCSRIWRMRRWTRAGLVLEPPNGPELRSAGLEPRCQTVTVAPPRQLPQSRIHVRTHRVA
jgi:hypothetical protein